jgi:hypothetical protein
MNKTLLHAAVGAAIGLMISGSVNAGNPMNATRTLTTGIGSGTTSTGVRSSLPYNSSRASRNVAASKSYSNYERAYSNHMSGQSNGPGSTYHSSATTPSTGQGKPDSFPGSSAIGGHASSTPAGSKTTFSVFPPANGNSNPGHPGGGIPATVSTAIPASVNTGAAAAGMPPALPSGAAAGIERASGHMSAHVPGGVPDAAFSGMGNRPSGVGRP